jgi:hypothetical protein
LTIHLVAGLPPRKDHIHQAGGATLIDPAELTETEIEERGATAAAMLVLGRLIDRVEACD